MTTQNWGTMDTSWNQLENGRTLNVPKYGNLMTGRDAGTSLRDGLVLPVELNFMESRAATASWF